MKPPKTYQLEPIWPPGFTPKFDSVRVIRIGDSIRQFGPEAKYGGSNGGAGVIDLGALRRAGVTERELQGSIGVRRNGS